MLNEKQIERMLGKLAKFEEKLGTMLFDKVDDALDITTFLIIEC